MFLRKPNYGKVYQALLVTHISAIDQVALKLVLEDYLSNGSSQANLLESDVIKHKVNCLRPLLSHRKSGKLATKNE